MTPKLKRFFGYSPFFTFLKPKCFKRNSHLFTRGEIFGEISVCRVGVERIKWFDTTMLKKKTN